MNSLQVSPQRAARELLKRRKARKSLIAFTEYTFPKYKAAAHHKLLARALEKVESGEIDRLMITMPPRHGKSELSTRRFPAWYLGRNPDKDIISSSYNSDLANDFGRDVRNIVGDPLYMNVFKDGGLASDSKAANRFATPKGGNYVAAGVGTATTGRGAHVLLIDDPFKDREDADSEKRRETVWGWYTSTAYTRLEDGGAVIVIQTRWHEDDLAGRLLEKMKEDGDDWVTIDFPAIRTTKSGKKKALWPAKYDIAALTRIKNNVGKREWSALYQQQPTPDDGEFFKRDWFDMYQEDALPKALNYYGTSDYAVSDDKGDYTVHSSWGIAPDGDIWLIDGWYGKTPSDVWIETKLDLIKKRRHNAWFGEKGTIEKAVNPMLRRRMRERKAFCRMEWIASITDKASRARGFQARASMKTVHLPDNDFGHWILDQLLKFPAGKHDDGVDVCSMIGLVLDQAHPAIKTTITKDKPRPKDYRGPRQESAGWR